MGDAPTPGSPFASWDHRGLPAGLGIPGGLSIEATVARVGRYTWAETRLSEILGAWVATVPELHVKERLGAHCHKHAWHAQLWRERLPELRGMDTEGAIQPANDAMVRFMDALTAPEAPELTIEKLVGAYRVLVPRFIAAYTWHFDNTGELTDGPTVRALRFILQDEFDDWRDGEMLLQSLIATPADARRASEHQAHLEAIMVEAGGVVGPDSIGQPAPA